MLTDNGSCFKRRWANAVPSADSTPGTQNVGREQPTTIAAKSCITDQLERFTRTLR